MGQRTADLHGICARQWKAFPYKCTMSLAEDFIYQGILYGLVPESNVEKHN